MIYLVRHGQTDWNVERKIQGNTDIPLNEIGELQARNAAENISKLKIDKIISSDLSRARQTAEIINEKVGANIKLDKRLREVNYGDFEGNLVENLTEQDWQIFDKNPEKINGESRIEVYKRIKSLFDEIDEEENTLIVTHGGALRMIMYYANNKDKFDLEKYIDCTQDIKIHNAELLQWEKGKEIRKDNT